MVCQTYTTQALPIAPQVLNPASITITSIQKVAETDTTEDIRVYITVGQGADLPAAHILINGVDTLGAIYLPAGWVGDFLISGLPKGNVAHNICIS